jgi:hypothetical protein
VWFSIDARVTTIGGTVMHDPTQAVTIDELNDECGSLLPAKEVLSLLDLNVDIDLALNLAAPIDLAVAANLNVAAPINAAVGANVLSIGSHAAAQSDQGVLIDQHLSGDAIAHAPQSAMVDQSHDIVPGPDVPTHAPVDGVTTSSLMDGDLLHIDVHAAVDADLAAPVAGAVAANANVAAPIAGAVSANVGSFDSTAVAVSHQDAVITQVLDGVLAEAVAAQDAEITQ